MNQTLLVTDKDQSQYVLSHIVFISHKIYYSQVACNMYLI